jgi:general secretion pathway protein J
MISHRHQNGFTLVELLAALLVLSLLALMAYRGLGAVLDAREHVSGEADKWRRVAAFFARFQRDVELAAPRPVREATGTAPAWIGNPGASSGPLLELSRFASPGSVDSPRRIAYRLDRRGDIELWVWPGLDVAPGVQPVRYTVLSGVTRFEIDYMDASLAWVNAWPGPSGGESDPRAVRVRVTLASGEELVRVFALAA